MFGMHEVGDLVHLSEAQKDQVYSALYQVVLDEKNTGYTPSNFESVMDAQAQAKEDALAKILTPDQLAIYTQQVQSRLQFQKAQMQADFKKASQGPPGISVSGGTLTTP
jgi:hypothetical protein